MFYVMRGEFMKNIINKIFEASSGSVGRNESLIWQQDRDI